MREGEKDELEESKGEEDEGGTGPWARQWVLGQYVVQGEEE